MGMRRSGAIRAGQDVVVARHGYQVRNDLVLPSLLTDTYSGLLFLVFSVFRRTSLDHPVILG